MKAAAYIVMFWIFAAGTLLGWGLSELTTPDCPRQQVRVIEHKPSLLRDCWIVEPGQCQFVTPHELQNAALRRISGLCT